MADDSSTYPASLDASIPVVLGPGAEAFDLMVNGACHPVRVPPAATLAAVLRDVLGLTGTKIACNHGACSACTVWLDGVPVCSCLLLAAECAGRAVTTIEGLAGDGVLHPVQQAFIDHDAVQCGYCTPGMVMSCAALLRENPDPGPQDIRAAIAGHLCRCGTYPHVLAAVAAAAKMVPAAPGAP